MFPHKNTNSFFTKLTKSASLSKLFDVYDKDSAIREYVLDNVFVCIFMYLLFYLAIWYAHKIIKRIEEKNQEMLVSVERNRSRLDQVIELKDKRMEYETFVIKAKGTQKEATFQLDSEMTRLSSELVLTMDKLIDLENFLTQWKLWKNCTERAKKRHQSGENDFYEGDQATLPSGEEIKVLEPSFPPPTPPEPPPRKFGVFARPPLPICSGGSGNPSQASQKIGFKH